MNRVARRGRQKGDISEIVNIFVAVEGRNLWRKNKFSKKVSQCRKTEREDPLGFLNIQSVLKIKEIEGGTLWRETNFRKKVSQWRKTERGDPLGFFNIHSVAKHQKIERGEFLFSGKKSYSAEKI